MPVHASELSDFSVAERWALVRDGHAVVTEGIICPLDTPPGPGLRLDAHLCTDRDDAVAIEQSALWVLGAIRSVPKELHIAGLDGARLYVGSSDVHARELNIQRTDCVAYGKRLVTSPARTAADIARYSPNDKTALAELTALSEKTPYDCRSALAIVGRTVHLPFARRARERLGAALADAVGVVDTVNASNGVEEAFEVTGVAHFEHKPIESKAFRGRTDRGGKNVDVVLRQNAGDI